jgi:hypothetical protein
MDRDDFKTVVRPGEVVPRGKSAKWQWEVWRKKPPTRVCHGVTNGAQAKAHADAREALIDFLDRKAKR